MSSYCRLCRLFFDEKRALRRHSQAHRHSYCDGCDKPFVNKRALEQHRFAVHAYGGSSCSEIVPSPHSPGKHAEDEGHETTVARLADHYCQPCEREFGDERALEQHMSSVIHKPLCANLKCVGGNGCKKKFTSPSAMIHHLESGACTSKLTRNMINEFLAQHDTTNIILSPQYSDPKLLKNDDSDSSTTSDDQTILTPLTPTTFSRRTSIDAQSDTSFAAAGILTPFSGDVSDIEDVPLLRRFVCPLCPPQRGQFGSAKSLENHMASPAHAPKIYHCPVALIGDVGRKKVTVKTFSTLSGLTQHLERDACAGGNTTFRNAVAFVNEKFKSLGLRDVRLLG
ncbi:hypothetical protein GP486_006120 [Trichoglossum hirsutum]|uniref:C2H2-type domain-containing protein n=1 Tax=Trichoglossum hirsutum TaxID=265104 RepID=A0A9P8L7Z0_9PEZI|nr:hypothetical protein GP486_006120 [Trichoglossum hirsutum]